MTRVAHVCIDPGVPVFGTKGASVHVQEIVGAWRRRGADVRIYCTRTGSDVPPDLADVPVTCIPVTAPRDDHAARERAQAQAATDIAAAVIRDGVDVVYERHSLFSTALADVTATTGAAGILEVNAPLIDEQARHRVLLDTDAAHRALRTQVQAAARTVAVSDPVAGWVRSHVPGATPMVCPNGVDTTRFTPGTPHHPTAEAPATVVFVGTLKPWHGVEVLLEAAALARAPWRVRIVGDGPQAGALADQAARLDLDVDFVGAVDPAAVPALLHDVHLAVAPYPAGQDQYFSPLKVVEYAAAGLPVVASAVGQIPHLVHDGVTGLLVPPSDPEALATAVDALVRVPSRARRLGAAARARAEARHTWDTVLDRVLDGLAPGATS